MFRQKLLENNVIDWRAKPSISLEWLAVAGPSWSCRCRGRHRAAGSAIRLGLFIGKLQETFWFKELPVKCEACSKSIV